jgi:hypothetical protein
MSQEPSRDEQIQRLREDVDALWRGIPKRPKNSAIERERDGLLVDIAAAFGGVSREGGISWSEADVIDDYGSMEERQKARAADTERGWNELLDHPDWQDSPWMIGTRFCSFDGIAFRYYLAPAMIRTIEVGGDIGLRFHLRPPESSDTERSREYRRQQLTALTEAQRRCVHRFIEYMIAVAEAEGNPEDAGDWRTVLWDFWTP